VTYKDFSVGVLELLQGECGLATAGAADHDQRGWQAIYRFLRIVEGQRFVQEMHGGALRV
jgi:hypothetical protein